MKKNLCIIGLVVASLLICSTGHDANADIFGKDKPETYTPSKGKATPTVHLAGNFSGKIGKTIRLNGRKIVVMKDTNIFSGEKGRRLQRGEYVAGKSLYVAGVNQNGVIRATLIIVKDETRRAGKDAGEVDPNEGS